MVGAVHFLQTRCSSCCLQPTQQLASTLSPNSWVFSLRNSCVGSWHNLCHLLSEIWCLLSCILKVQITWGGEVTLVVTVTGDEVTWSTSWQADRRAVATFRQSFWAVCSRFGLHISRWPSSSFRPQHCKQSHSDTSTTTASAATLVTQLWYCLVCLLSA